MDGTGDPLGDDLKELGKRVLDDIKVEVEEANNLRAALKRLLETATEGEHAVARARPSCTWPYGESREIVVGDASPLPLALHPDVAAEGIAGRLEWLPQLHMVEDEHRAIWADAAKAVDSMDALVLQQCLVLAGLGAVPAGTAGARGHLAEFFVLHWGALKSSLCEVVKFDIPCLGTTDVAPEAYLRQSELEYSKKLARFCGDKPRVPVIESLCGTYPGMKLRYNEPVPKNLWALEASGDVILSGAFVTSDVRAYLTALGSLCLPHDPAAILVDAEKRRAAILVGAAKRRAVNIRQFAFEAVSKRIAKLERALARPPEMTPAPPDVSVVPAPLPSLLEGGDRDLECDGISSDFEAALASSNEDSASSSSSSSSDSSDSSGDSSSESD